MLGIFGIIAFLTVLGLSLFITRLGLPATVTIDLAQSVAEDHTAAAPCKNL